MKKIYVMAAFLGMLSVSFGQEKLDQKTINSLHRGAAIQSYEALPAMVESNAKPINNNSTEKAGEFFNGDFADANQWLIGGTIGVSTWSIEDATSWPGWNLGGGQLIIPPISTTESFAVFDNFDPATTTPPYSDQGGWIQINETFDFSGEATVALSFDQVYAGLNFDQTFVEYSTDGGANWERIEVNADVAANETYTSSEKFNLNTNNSTNFLIRFYYENLRSATAPETQQGSYVWELHNVKVSEVVDNDVAVASKVLAGFGPGVLSTYDVVFSDDPTIYGIGEDLFKYKQIPLSQVQAVNSMIRVENLGKLNQEGVAIKATEASAGYTSTSTPITLATGADAIMKVENGFTPAAVGDYTIEYEIVADATDEFPSNNQIESYNFSVGQYTYAVDDAGDAAKSSATLPRAWSASGIGKPIEIGVLYEIVSTVELTAIDIKLGFNSPSEGDEVWGVIYKDGENVMNQVNPTYLTETEHYVNGSDDKGKYLTLMFDEPVTLTPGKYVVSAKSFDLDFSVASSGDNNYYGTFIYGDLAVDPGVGELWFVLSDDGAPVIRMNFDPTLSVSSNELNELGLTQYPNPFSNETTVQFTLKDASEVSYTVVDVTGKVVANVTEGQMMAGVNEITIDGSSFANGVYYLNLTAGNSNVTHKMVVNK